MLAFLGQAVVLVQTGAELDVAIQGRGFFQVQDPNGDTLYTRAGQIDRNANGNLVISSANIGRQLQPPITIPETATQVVISGEGIVQYREAGSSNLTQAGQIELAQFINPGGLLREGEGLFSATDASGTATAGNPGADGLGTLQQGALEASNVKPVEELISLITTQRAFELNSKAVQVGDDIMQVVANLRRY